jgi:L-iditol 2-dehydrogenase
MKAAVYYGPRDVRVEECPTPVPGPNEVLIRVQYCGVCGTDLHIFNGEGGFVDVVPPLIPGHELCGTVEALGPGATAVKVGDRVTVNPNQMCGECYFCQNAMEHFCRRPIGYGTVKNGGFAEYIAVRERQVFPYSDELDPLAAAMTEPVSCCIHGIDLCHIRVGAEVLVIGGGPIGQIMLQLAKNSGASKVILSEPVAQKRALAEKLGATLTVDPTKDDVSAVLARHCQNIDTVIECLGNVHTLADAIRWAGRGATVMMFGLAGPEAELPVKPDVVFKKELKLTSSYINPYTFGRALKTLESGAVDVTSLVSKVMDLDDINEVFTRPELRRDGKVVIRC